MHLKTDCTTVQLVVSLSWNYSQTLCKKIVGYKFDLVMLTYNRNCCHTIFSK